MFGRGVRIRDGLEGVEEDYQFEATSMPSGVRPLFASEAMTFGNKVY